jgi:hypothetical protein
MNTQILRNSAKRLGLALAMLFSLVLLGGISAQAQDRGRENRDRNNDRYDTNDSITYRSAVQYGHRDGMSQGRNDARRNRASNCEGSRHYQSARRGYNSRHGSYPAYQGAYRGGFTRGYNEAFSNDAYRRNRRPN